MVSSLTDVGQYIPLTKRLAKALASAAIVGTLAFGAWTLSPAETIAGGETRTISMYHTHTKENITITYMKDGRYVPSAMKKINFFLRDWRRNEVIAIDPKSIDLVWELHADLRSNRPVHIVSGYRSPKTNAFLKRIGRNVAKRSQHMRGKAIDFYFPDVKTVNIRNSALVRRVGGVGYYRSSGGPSGFLHVDSGNVRTWGPAISRSQMASIMGSAKKTVGARFKGSKSAAMIAVADSGSASTGKKKSGGLISWAAKKITGEELVDEQNVAPLEGAYADADGELAGMAAAASFAGKGPSQVTPLDDAMVEQVSGEDEDSLDGGTDAGGLANMAQTAAVESLGSENPKQGYAVIKPRFKPQTVLAMATAEDNVTILPASAPPESQTLVRKPSVVADSLAELAEASAKESLYDEAIDGGQVSNTSAKTSFAAELRDGTTDEAPLIGPVIASLDGGDASWWDRLFVSGDSLVRRDGAPPSLDVNVPDILPRAAVLGPDGSGIVGDSALVAAAGKGDSLFVNREGKGHLETTDLRLPQPLDLSELQ